MTSVELSTELESIILDTVMRVPISKSRRPGTNSPMDFGMAAKGDHDETKGDEELRIADLHKVLDTQAAGAWTEASSDTAVWQ